MNVSVRVDFRAVQAALGALQKQASFATSLAMNNTAKEVRSYLKEHLDDTMTLRNKWTAGGIRQVNATKRKLWAAIGSIDPYMAAQEKAGWRKKAGGRLAGRTRAAMAVPTKAIRKTPAMKIGKGKRPKALMLKPKHFIREVNSGAVILFRRKHKRKAYPIIPLWVFVRRVRLGLGKKWKLRDRSQEVIERVWAEKALEAVSKALETARK